MVKYNFGNIMYEYFERGALKQWGILQRNFKELRNEQWLKELYDNGIYSIATCEAIYTDPFKTMFEQEGVIDAFKNDEQLRQQLIKRIKDLHMDEMVEAYGLGYAQILTGKKKDS